MLFRSERFTVGVVVQKYSEYKPGDKLAEYGLGALVVGGAAAAAAKSGLLKGLGKFLWVAVFGVAAGAWTFIKRIFAGKSNGQRQA